jgi:hypothetical protein
MTAREQIAIWGLLLLASVSLVTALTLALGVVPALASVAGVLLGLFPWTYDKWKEYSRRQRQLDRIRVVFAALTGVVTDRLPALLDRFAEFLEEGSEREEATLQSIVGKREGVIDIDTTLLEELAEGAISSKCDHTVVEELGMEVLRNLVLHLSSSAFDRSLSTLARSVVKSFMGEQIEFLDAGPSLNPTGEVFAKVVTFLRDHQRVDDLEALRTHLRARLDPEERDKLTLELSDPQLSFLVYELGKASDLLDVAQREMSGKRLIGRLTARISRRGSARQRRYNAFLILKQEMREGDRYIKQRIDAVPNRIVAYPARIYLDNALSRYQTMNVLRLSSRYANGEEFFAKHFSQIANLREAELKRAGLVAIPIATDAAYYYPEDVSILRPPQQVFYKTWSAFFGKDRRVFQEMLSDFDVSFLDLIDHLTLDFLVKSVVPGEKEYLRQRTDRVLATFGAKNLLEVAQVPPDVLATALKGLGYPSYRSVDLLPFIETFTLPLREFFDYRLREISNDAVRNAKRILNLRRAAK